MAAPAKTVAFSQKAANVFLHITTRCNLNCRHCYVNPEQHGSKDLTPETIAKWLRVLARRCPQANLVLLGGEPTLHRGLPAAVRQARRLGYGSITIDTNGYLFHEILTRVTPAEVDYFSFSLDGASAATNDALRGEGSYTACTAGMQKAAAAGFRTSLIYTVSKANIEELPLMAQLLPTLGVERFFIQVIGLRGSAAGHHTQLAQVARSDWLGIVTRAAGTAAEHGIHVTYPKVYLAPDEPFECAGRVADNYFIFPNGRVYRCPLCEDSPLHAFTIDDKGLNPTPRINEADLFELDIPEGCVMNRLLQPDNITYDRNGAPEHKIACCLLKQEQKPSTT